MRNIPPPITAVEEILKACAKSIQNKELSGRIINSLAHFSGLETEYKNRALASLLYMFPVEDVTAGISQEEMSWLYSKVFSRLNGPTRHLYDAIKLAAPGLICPLCNQRTVGTLDHQLSKQNYPSFAVTPFNMVPACRDCNSDTGARALAVSDDQTFHPYFDRVDDEIWLYATLEESSPPVFKFEVRPPQIWAPEKQKKVEKHFNTFKLAVLYSVHAASELQNIKDDVLRIAYKEGLIGLQDEFTQRALGRRRKVLNNWQAAMYSALAMSEWFCKGGYIEI
jgi:hypothetical protein